MRQRKSRPLRTVSNSGALQIQTVRISVKNTTRGLSSRTLHRLSLRVRRAALFGRSGPGCPLRVGALARWRDAAPPTRPPAVRSEGWPQAGVCGTGPVGGTSYEAGGGP